MENAQDIRKLVGPEDCADHVSHGGQTYEANQEGVFEVPALAAAELLHHGFKPVPVEKKSAPQGNAQQNGQRK